MTTSMQFHTGKVARFHGWSGTDYDDTIRYFFFATKFDNGDQFILVAYDDPDQARAVLRAQLAMVDALDPAKGGLEHYDAPWPPKRAESEEAPRAS